MPNYWPEHFPYERKIVQGSDLALFFGNWSQSEKSSEIKLPLGLCFFLVFSILVESAN